MLHLLQQTIRYSIKAKLVAMTVGIVVSVVVVLTSIIGLISANLLNDESNRQLSQSVEQSVELLSNFVSAREINLDLWASSPLVEAVFSDPAMASVFIPSLRGYFAKIKNREPWIENIFLIQENAVIYDDSDAFEFSEETDHTPHGLTPLWPYLPKEFRYSIFIN